MSWSYAENQSIELDPTAIEFKPAGTFYQDIAAYCELAKIKVHPSFKETKIVITQLTQAALAKEGLELDSNQKEQKELAKKEIDCLCIYTSKLDKNSIYALQAVLPASKVTTLK